MPSPSADLRSLIDDVADEHAALAAVVDPLPESTWASSTPSPGWTIAHQIAHLTFFDDTATTAIVDPDRFATQTGELLARIGAGEDMDSLTLRWADGMAPGELAARWRANRRRLIDAARTLDDDRRIPWYGPSMGAKSFLTARLMETWAHGQDIVDAVASLADQSPADQPSTDRPPTDRLRHIAQLGVITRGWSYKNRGLPVPDGTVAVVLSAPSGATWTWNDDAERADTASDASPDGDPTTGPVERISGPAEDFCLVVTQRRHVDDTSLRVDGGLARDWMDKAQAFAGAATDGPARAGTNSV